MFIEKVDFEASFGRVAIRQKLPLDRYATKTNLESYLFYKHLIANATSLVFHNLG